jgi:hypothetical protein
MAWGLAVAWGEPSARILTLRGQWHCVLIISMFSLDSPINLSSARDMEDVLGKPAIFLLLSSDWGRRVCQSEKVQMYEYTTNFKTYVVSMFSFLVWYWTEVSKLSMVKGRLFYTYNDIMFTYRLTKYIFSPKSSLEVSRLRIKVHLFCWKLGSCKSHAVQYYSLSTSGFSDICFW